MTRCLLLMIFCSLLACDFTPRGEILTSVLPPDLSDVALIISYPGDTVRSFQTRTINYTVAGKEVEDAATAVILNGDTLQIDQSSKGKFTLDANALGTGIYPLRIYSNFTVHTKNLEGVALNEYFQIARNWVVMIDIDPPNAVQITKIETINNLPVIHWEKYIKVNFQNYQLIRKCYQASTGLYLNCGDAVFTDPNTLAYADSKYNGFPMKYYIVVTASNLTASGNLVSYP